MRINEILDSTKSWAAIANIELEIPENIQYTYRQNIEMLTTAKTFKDTVDSTQWSQMILSITKQISAFIMPANQYIAKISSLNIKNDPDLNKRIRKVQKMKSNLIKLLDAVK